MRILKLLVCTGLSLLAHALCADPMKGWYAGPIFSGSYPTAISFSVLNPFTGVPTGGELSYNLGGGIGGQLGIRCDHFRVEVEGLFNSDPYSKLTIDDLVIKRHDTLIGGIPFHFKGNTQFYTGILNGYYDFYQFDSDFVPYLGLGIGYAHVTNELKFYSLDVPLFSINKTNNSLLGQAIVGAQYFVDETVSIGLDYRFVALSNFDLQTITGEHNDKFMMNTINLTFNFAFESDLGIS